jgi:hypothetical protein
MLSPEFQEFVNKWLAKADRYGDANLEDLFDAFFTLFVVYNRLYAETTFVLAREGKITIDERKPFPDAKAAKVYVVKYLTANRLVADIDTDPDCKAALDSIIQLLDNNTFSIKLDLIQGNPQPDLDLALLRDLRSADAEARSRAILDVLYSMRCNMFHGHKGFSLVQATILRPATVLLRRVIDILFTRTQDPTTNCLNAGNSAVPKRDATTSI